MQMGVDHRLAVDLRDYKTTKAAQCKLSIVVNTANRPYATGFLEMTRVFNLGAHLVAREFRVVANYNYMTITHSNCNISSII
jgi:glutaredoxin-related protein